MQELISVGGNRCSALDVRRREAESVTEHAKRKITVSSVLRILTGGIVGAITGSMLAGKIAQRPLRVALLLALIILGCQLALRRA